MVALALVPIRSLEWGRHAEDMWVRWSLSSPHAIVIRSGPRVGIGPKEFELGASVRLWHSARN